MNVNSNLGGFSYGMQKKKELMQQKEDLQKLIENKPQQVESNTNSSSDGPKWA